jgi:uncharacterized membrane protein YfcA
MSPSLDGGILLISVVAGFVGALGGIGGGMLVVPALTILFGVPLHVAIGASIVSVIATSSGAAASYVRDRLTNLRVAMFLELATTTGAVAGALLAGAVASSALLVLLGIVLLGSAVQQLLRLGEELPPTSDSGPLAARLQLVGSYPDARLGREVAYAARRIPLGLGLMAIAGMVSGLLGIGSGALKVLAMDGAMRLPMKVSSTTSNFMIGVTAAASAGVYLGRGQIEPTVATPVALGVFMGAMAGARLLPHLSNRQVRRAFVPILVIIGLETLAKGFGVGL